LVKVGFVIVDAVFVNLSIDIILESLELSGEYLFGSLY